MAKLQKILVAYDGSPQSKEALYCAIYFSRQTGAAVHAVKVFEPYFRESKWKEVGNLSEEMFEHFAAAENKDLQMMEAVKELGREQEIDITTDVLSGHVAHTLLEYAQKHEISIIIAGTRGKGALQHLLLGSVTHGLVSVASIPVLVVKECQMVQHTDKALIMNPLRTIVVAYDGHPQSVVALNWAIAIAKLTGAQVTVVKVCEPFQAGEAYTKAEGRNAARTSSQLRKLEEMNANLMNEAKELGKQQGVEINTHLLNGGVLESLLEFTEKQGIDMIAVGAHGRGILDKFPFGSVPHGLISLSPIPVLVVKK